MNLSFRAFVNWVKDLDAAIKTPAPSDNPGLDKAVLASLATDILYVRARNGERYWYYVTDKQNIDVAKYMLRSNGVSVSEHNSRYYEFKRPVLRVRTDRLHAVPATKNFVSDIMGQKSTLGADVVQYRIQQIKNKIR